MPTKLHKPYHSDISERLAAIAGGVETYAEFGGITPQAFAQLYEEETCWDNLRCVLTSNCHSSQY